MGRTRGIILLFHFWLLTTGIIRAQVAINSTGDNPDPSAMLDVSSADKGILIPRLDRTAVSNPAEGLLVYDLNEQGFYFYNGTGWVRFSSVEKLDDLLDAKSDEVTSVFLGFNAGQNDGGNTYNVGVGIHALLSNTDGDANVGIGFEALKNNTIADDNVAVGYRAMYANTEGERNVAIGFTALLYNETGSQNIAIGPMALFGSSGTSFSDNIAIGTGALSDNEADYNIAIGTYALHNNSTGFPGLAIGYEALKDNTEGVHNIGIGFRALYSNTEGEANIGIGSQTLYLNETGNFNVAIGKEALQNNTGSQNTALGYEALKANADQGENVAVGYHALTSATAARNTAVGSGAGEFITTGEHNTLVGYEAGGNFEEGNSNTAVGYHALFGYNFGSRTTTNGSGNTAVGRYALFQKTGNNNVAVGYFALSWHNRGSYNVAIGMGAEPSDGDPNYAVMLGAHSEANADNAVAIGYQAQATQPNTMVLGSIPGVNDADAQMHVLIGTQTPDAGAHLTLGPMDGDLEGGQITWYGAGDHDTWRTDVYGEDFRIFSYHDGINNLQIFNFYDGQVTDLRLDGSGYALQWYETSDRRIKSQIRPLHYGLETIMLLRPVQYRLHSVDYHSEGFKISSSSVSSIGLIAQEVYPYIPEVVSKPSDEHRELWAIDYAKLVPVLIRAIQQQQSQIEELKRENRLLNEKLNRFISNQ
ncbi:MAG: hypothetical protein GXO27_05715 [Chlorobi bacterium]|nr:hypothetical protein [Chlorobiota bacterium]